MVGYCNCASTPPGAAILLRRVKIGNPDFVGLSYPGEARKAKSEAESEAQRVSNCESKTLNLMKRYTA